MQGSFTLLHTAHRQRQDCRPRQDGRKNPRAVVAGQQKDHLCRRFFDDFEQGVLRLLGHIVDVAQDVYLVSAFIGTDVGIHAQLTYPVDVKAFELVLVPDDRYIGMGVGQHPFTVSAPTARALLERLFTQQSSGSHVCKGQLAAAILAFQKDGMRKTPVS